MEDHDIMRFGLVLLLNREHDMEVVAEAKNAQAALRHLAETPVDLVLLDLTLPDMEGLQLIKLIQTRLPKLPVLVATMHDELRYGDRALAAGARGYVMKSESPDTLLYAIRQVARGGTFVSKNLMNRMTSTAADEPIVQDLKRVSLTDREIDVLALLGQGFSSAEIAIRLHRSIKTIDAHRENIKKKLALKNANELLRYAVCWVEEESRMREPVTDEVTDGVALRKAPLLPGVPLPLPAAEVSG